MFGLIKRRNFSQFDYQMIGIRNEELASPYMGNKLAIIEQIMLNYRRIEEAYEEGYEKEALENAVKIVGKNGFLVDLKKRKIKKV